MSAQTINRTSKTAASRRLLEPGKVTILRGPAGCGKSTLAVDLAERMRRGVALPDGVRYESGDVLGSYLGKRHSLGTILQEAGLSGDGFDLTRPRPGATLDADAFCSKLFGMISDSPSCLFVLDHWKAMEEFRQEMPRIIDLLRPALEANETALLVVSEKGLHDKVDALERTADTVVEVLTGKPVATSEDEAEIVVAGCLRHRKGAGLPLRFRILGDRYSGLVTWLPW